MATLERLGLLIARGAPLLELMFGQQITGEIYYYLSYLQPRRRHLTTYLCSLLSPLPPTAAGCLLQPRL